METFNSAVSGIGNGRIKIEAHDSKNASEIRKTDTALTVLNEELKNAEGLKPKRCDCDCPFITGGATDSIKIKAVSQMKK